MLQNPLHKGVFLLQKRMRSGRTTGTCAAAALKAALLAWRGEMPAQVNVQTPQGNWLQVPVEEAAVLKQGGRAVVRKDAGDDPDITHGALLVAEVSLHPGEGWTLSAGPGVGTVTKPGLAMAPGEPAINPGPRRMLALVLDELLPEGMGAEVTLSIPGGEELAKRTLNPSLGICGGLSIIGTTGIVEPMSEEAFKNSLAPQLRVAQAQGFESVVLVPGRIGQDAAILKYGLPDESVVQMSNFVGFMLTKAAEFGLKKVLLFGHLGKLAKVAAGIFHTHNRMADGRMETLAAYAALLGASQETVKDILDATTTEGAMPFITAAGLGEKLYPLLAVKASERAKRHVFGDLEVGTVIVTLQGELLGMDEDAKKIGETMGWNIKSL